MRVVTLEEHFSLILPGSHNNVAPPPAGTMPDVVANAADKMTDIVGGRLADMDRNGITVQVLSKAGVHITPSADQFEGKEAVEFAKKFNDAFARKVAERPDRFAAFTHLAASVPEAAADELERTVTEYGFKGTLISGTIRGAFLDDPKFAPLLARAEKLDVPIYIHPGMPPADVRKAYYEGFSNNINFGLATFAWGWHYEVALHVMRLAVSGTMDKYPKLNFIIGHMGEGLPVMLARCEHQFGRELSFLVAAAVEDDHRPGLRHLGGFLHQPAICCRAGNLRHRPADVLGRLSLCQQRRRKSISGKSSAVSGRPCQIRARQCR